ncbi:hypothetical protein EJ08DRAFT_736918 [Tothia fuscella]|uniref:Uncharacterized protein n=1 Tax=Tothia fuscella TaxID=1048955 RepID=A0A9P4NJW2_9PEZI|nr:hypothetical protein EJ08DRAFT_736918 [Tothia fuscella]
MSSNLIMAYSLFTDLSQELILLVSRHLGTEDYGNLRRTCSYIEKQLFEDFAKHFFTTRQFMLTHYSLQTLIDISNHDALGGHLRKIIIGTNIIAEPASGQFIRTGTGGTGPTDQQRAYASKEYLDQQYLTSMGGDVSMLTDAFRRLSNCREVEIRDYNSGTRYRDGADWKSYGATKYELLSGLHIELGLTYTTTNVDRSGWLSHVFSVVLSAIVESRLNCEALMVTTRYQGLEAKAFHFPAWRQSELETSLKQLKTLQLNLHSLGDPSGHQGVNVYKSMLRLMPNLTSLRYNTSQHYDIEPPMEATMTTLAPCPIRTLEFGKFTSHTGMISDFICQYRQSLGRLELYKIGLTMSSLTWDGLLRELEDFPALKHFKLTFVTQNHSHVGFKGTEDRDKPAHRRMVLESSVALEAKPGAEMRDAIRTLRMRLVIKDNAFLNSDAESDSEDSNSDSDSDENINEGSIDESDEDEGGDEDGS